MPRRIIDYPDAFAGWNLVASGGSLISLVITGFFISLICNKFEVGYEVPRDGWVRHEFLEDILAWIDNARLSKNIEWVLDSPPHYHSFNKLPVQSFIPMASSGIFDIFMNNLEYIIPFIFIIPLYTLYRNIPKLAKAYYAENNLRVYYILYFLLVIFIAALIILTFKGNQTETISRLQILKLLLGVLVNITSTVVSIKVNGWYSLYTWASFISLSINVFYTIITFLKVTLSVVAFVAAFFSLTPDWLHIPGVTDVTAKAPKIGDREITGPTTAKMEATSNGNPNGNSNGNNDGNSNRNSLSSSDERESKLNGLASNEIEESDNSTTSTTDADAQNMGVTPTATGINTGSVAETQPITPPAPASGSLADDSESNSSVAETAPGTVIQNTNSENPTSTVVDNTNANTPPAPAPATATAPVVDNGGPLRRSARSYDLVGDHAEARRREGLGPLNNLGNGDDSDIDPDPDNRPVEMASIARPRVNGEINHNEGIAQNTGEQNGGASASHTTSAASENAESSSSESSSEGNQNAESNNSESSSEGNQNIETGNPETSSVENQNIETGNSGSSSEGNQNIEADNPETPAEASENGEASNSQTAAAASENGEANGSQTASAASENGEASGSQTASAASENGESTNSGSTTGTSQAGPVNPVLEAARRVTNISGSYMGWPWKR